MVERVGGASAVTTPGRPDASMSLLIEIMDRPLDPSYEAAAKARALRGEAPRRRPWNTAVVGLTALASGLLFATSGLTYARADAGRDGRVELVERIEQRQQEADEAAARNVALESRLHTLEAGAVGDDPVAVRLERVRDAAGASPVEGPGLRITLDDAPGLGPVGGGGPRDDTDDDTGRIVYRDLQNVTNDLWAAGAEAVAVNGHRLTSTTAIRFAGRAILVGFRPLARPYVVEAVMGPESQAAYTRGAGGAYLADLRTAFSARAEAHAEARLRLPAADPTRLRYARVSSRRHGDDTPADGTPSTAPTDAHPSSRPPAKENG
ncbi:DUF881 domain-containing protein [Mobilicoccus pelagius]|uniref:DUF881 domain-containing protein n=1 Tax=Mobilicoccus pelagius NBRC 104925 TaxID=1089455 RepID=H5UPE0_9MICO|nr:DUF881 domain-containing protein [Mobilicoccus pelagius]GAB47598.1 hypothetical protein MOPEL_021_00340 [Mobilicoccus pelagius NBRC 104925]